MDIENCSELRSELLKEKEKMPILIPEAPIVNPNAALGTPPRLNSDGEAIHDIEMGLSSNDERFDDLDDRKSDEYEMNIEINPSDYLDTPLMVTDDLDESNRSQQNINSQDVFQHTSEQHEVYVCSLCDKAFSSKGHLSLHARIHVGAGNVIGEKVITDDHTSYKRPYQCDLCNKSYSTAKHRWGHVSTTHRGHPAVTCRFCSRIYSTRTNLKDHIKSKHTGLSPPLESSGPYVQQDQCKSCPKMYTNVTDLNKHSRGCLGERLKIKDIKKHFKLPIKGRCLMDTSDVSSNESDDESREYRNAEAKLSKNPQLTILKQALTRTDGLKNDTKKSHIKDKKLIKNEDIDSDGIPRWYCESCPQNFTSIHALEDHEKSHNVDKPYICILCEKDFVLKSSLAQHISISHSVDPTPLINDENCMKISKTQKYSTIKFENIKSEPSELSYSSSINVNPNNDEELSPDNLIEIETVFVCEICTRDFNDRASLWLHIRATHKEYAAFACGVCLKICSDNEQLLNHVNMYHGGSKLLVSEQKRYSCIICGRQHDSRKKLITHISIHNIDSSYDPASFVQLNSNYCNDNILINEVQEPDVDFDAEDGEKVNCHVCFKSFLNEDHLIRHQRNAHKSDQLLELSKNDTSNSSLNKVQYHLFFVCELCGSSHPSKWERWLHVSSCHSDEISVRCERSDCAKIFSTKSLKNEHGQHHAMQGLSPNTCEICGKLWGSRVDYWKHVMGVHADTVPLICGVCLKIFPDVHQLSSHVKSNHWPLTNGDFSCDICGRPYSNKSKMLRHRKIHGMENENYNNGINELMNDTTNNETADPDIDLICGLCPDMNFQNWNDLCNHRRVLHDIFTCDLCTKYYGRTSHLWKHVNRVHKGHKDVTCPYCMKTSASKDHLAAHIAKIHRYEPENKQTNDSTNFASPSTDDDIIHYCEKCNKGFHKRYLLRRHMKGCQNYRKDPGALLTRCRACERIFKDRASLQKHIENHHSNYTCHLCDETITSKLGIMTHNRVQHMNHPDLTCTSCKKLFRTKEDLELHKKNHKYHNSLNVCDFCGDTVENKLKLKMHILSLHRNEIGVSCGVCLIPMKDPKDLKKHVEDEHEGVLSKPNTCQVCGKQYASKWKAFDHTKKCHGKVFRTCKQCLAVFTTDDDIRHHYEHIHNVPKDQLAGFENSYDISARIDENSAGLRDDHDDLEYDNEAYATDISYETTNLKRKRNDTYECDICQDFFLNKQTFVEHYKNMHNKDPKRIFKKIKTSYKKKSKDNENYECKNCNKQFKTKSLYWNHLDACSNKNSKDDACPSNSISILESHLKNNNQIKRDPYEENLNEMSLNIPDFNLFEDINMQLSRQKPIPQLMPLASAKNSQNTKCYRKDSRKVYDESTNTVCACEVCGKQWPAKKHLWQHLIRFHRAEAAVTCGVCLKLCTTYQNLSQHLKDTHEAILSCEGNNFTCKTCGRYHNARSKLLLHMSIHINNNEHIWCSKCAVSFENQEKLDEHVNTCIVKRREEADTEDHSADVEENNVKQENEELEEGDKGSLIGDGASLMEEVDLDTEHEASDNGEDNSQHSEDSDSSSIAASGSDDEDEETNENMSGTIFDANRPTDSEGHESDHSGSVISQLPKKSDLLNNLNESKNANNSIELLNDNKTEANNSKKSKETKSDDERSPVSNPAIIMRFKNPNIVPNIDQKSNDSTLLVEGFENDENAKAEEQHEPVDEDTEEEEEQEEEDEEEEDEDEEKEGEEEEGVEGEGEEEEEVEGEEEVEVEKQVVEEVEEGEEKEEQDEVEQEDNHDNEMEEKIYPNENENELKAMENMVRDTEDMGAYEEDTSEKSNDEVESEVENVQDMMEDDDSRLQIEQDNEYVEEGDEEAFVTEHNDEEMQIEEECLDGTVLMVTNDADGNQILVQRNVDELEIDDSMGGVTTFIYHEPEDNNEEYEETFDENTESQEDDVVNEDDEEEKEEEEIRQINDTMEIQSDADTDKDNTIDDQQSEGSNDSLSAKNNVLIT